MHILGNIHPGLPILTESSESLAMQAVLCNILTFLEYLRQAREQTWQRLILLSLSVSCTHSIFDRTFSTDRLPRWFSSVSIIHWNWCSFNAFGRHGWPNASVALAITGFTAWDSKGKRILAARPWSAYCTQETYVQYSAVRGKVR